MLGQQLQQLPEPRGARGDATLRNEDAVLVDQRDVVMALRPVDATPDPHLSSPFCARVAGVTVASLSPSRQGCTSP